MPGKWPSKSRMSTRLGGKGTAQENIVIWRWCSSTSHLHFGAHTQDLLLPVVVCAADLPGFIRLLRSFNSQTLNPQEEKATGTPSKKHWRGAAHLRLCWTGSPEFENSGSSCICTTSLRPTFHGFDRFFIYQTHNFDLSSIMSFQLPAYIKINAIGNETIVQTKDATVPHLVENAI